MLFYALQKLRRGAPERRSPVNARNITDYSSLFEQQGILSPTGKPRWNREAINKLLSNEKYTGRVLLEEKPYIIIAFCLLFWYAIGIMR